MLARLFLSHPQKVDETYLEHARFAGSFSVKLFAAGFCAMVHAVLPFAFEKTANRMIGEMYVKTHRRGQ